MSIAEQQISASIRTIVLGGIHYKYRKVSSADIVAAGGAFLLSLAPRPRTRGEDEESEEAKKARLIDALKRDPALLGSGHRFQAAVVCASVFEASVDGETWEPYRLVMDLKHENGPAGRAHISVLGPHVGTLGRAVMALVNGKEGPAGEASASFPGGPPRGAADSARAHRKSVRHRP